MRWSNLLARACRDPGLNQGPSDLQSDALPTELSRLEREERPICGQTLYEKKPKSRFAVRKADDWTNEEQLGFV